MFKNNGALKFAVSETCLGWVGVIASQNGLKKVILPQKSKRALLDQIAQYGCKPENQDYGSLAVLANRLKRYLSGEPEDFSYKLDLSGTTRFQQIVWQIVRSIPSGETRSYGWVAGQLGLPKAARAVGRAVAENPVPIIIPCHRVVRGDGNLGGFGGGVETKKFLLNLERAA